MPLMKKRLPALERLRGESASKTMTASTEDYLDDHYDNMQEADDEYMSDGSIQSSAPQRKSPAPAVPPRSQLRASRNLENMNMNLDLVDRALLAEKSNERQAESDPYASYVSSEEDGSVSADDIDKSIIELDRESATSSRASSRCSHEDIARAVSFMFVGRPQLVDILPQTRPRSSLDRIKQARPRPIAILLAPKSSRSSSVSTRTSSLSRSSTLSEHRNHLTTSSSVTSCDNSIESNHLARDFIASTSGSSSSSNTTTQSFFQTDPFLTAQPHKVDLPLASTDAIPDTPTSPTNTSWKGSLKGVSKSLSLRAKKRPSMPKLSLTSTFGPSKHTLPTPSSVIPVASETPLSTSVPLARPSRDQAPVTYQDIMKNAIKAPPPTPITPDTPKKAKMGPNFLGLGRKKSAKSAAQGMGIPF